jgi:hypothetical protein
VNINDNPERREEDLAIAADFAEGLHAYCREQIALADQKAVFLFAGVAAMLAYLNNSGATERWLAPVAGWGLAEVLALVASLGLGLGALFSLLTVRPRLRGSAEGIFFFKGVLGFGTAESYAEQVLARSDRELVRERLLHSFELAAVCDGKYAMLRRSFLLGGIGLIAAVLVLIVG